MNKLSLLSIIIPVYNTALYLLPCVQSILDQTYKNIEILIVDDASTDDSLKIAKSIQDNRVKIIEQPKNKGQGAARNIGIEKAQGAYVCFVDSDDIVHSQMLEVLYKAIAYYNADLAYGDAIHTSSTNACPNDAIIINEFTLLDRPLTQHLSANPEVHMGVWAKLYKKELINSVKFYENIYNEDTLFSIMVLDKSAKAVYAKHNLYCYLQRPGSIMHSPFNLYKAKSNLIIATELYNYFSDNLYKRKQIQNRYINRIIKRSIKNILASPDKSELLDTLKPTIKAMYKQGIFNYNGLSPMSCWRMWKILHS